MYIGDTVYFTCTLLVFSTDMVGATFARVLLLDCGCIWSKLDFHVGPATNTSDPTSVAAHGSTDENVEHQYHQYCPLAIDIEYTAREVQLPVALPSHLSPSPL